MGMVNVPAGCYWCHKQGIGYSTCQGCGLHFCPVDTARLEGVCSNCGSKLI
jgi:hypothetical protein